MSLFNKNMLKEKKRRKNGMSMINVTG